MGAWPQDEAQAAALIVYGGTLAAVGGANSITTKSTHEAFGIPTPKANAEGLRMTRMAIYLARNLRLDSMPEFQAECDLIRREVVPVIDKILEMGDGDAARGHHPRRRGRRARHSLVAQPACQEPRHAGARCRRLSAHPRSGRDAVPARRARSPRAGLAAARGARGRRRSAHDLAVSSVYEISEQLERLMP